LLRSEELRRTQVDKQGGMRQDRRPKRRRRRIDFKSSPPTVRIDESKIRFKDSVRYLGVHFDRGMRVESHYKYLKSKVGVFFNKLGKLAKSQWGLKCRTLSTTYWGMFIPIVAYAAAG